MFRPVGFDISKVSCDEAKEVLRLCSKDELERLVPSLTKAQLAYVLAILPKNKQESIRKTLTNITPISD